uniref:Cystinosin homolog n=1 Tax=Haemonchus contortus TaxID=6289 RepID=A0A7I4YBR2_HAECO
MTLRLYHSILLLALVTSSMTLQSSVDPALLTVFLGVPETYDINSKVHLKDVTEIHFEQQPYVDVLSPLKFEAKTQKGTVRLQGRQVTSDMELKPYNCSSANHDDCPALLKDFYMSVTVLKSSLVNALVMIVGWSYFTAWSVSFYPQIVLNYQRKSVVGLNFDFLVLNIVGFSAYSIYNLFLFFDSNVQRIYEEAHPHSPIPVLINDVFFATHALFACVLTAAQCFIYERGAQRVSYVCISITVFMFAAACGAGVVTFLGFMNMLQFVTSLSYIKMAVTLLKYIPQALLNFRRKSTVGWSIGNVLLDFTGGCLDILQMVLQCWNVSEWSAFYGNPVKFGLGLVSSLFDILFITQHYVLYPHKTEQSRTDPEKSGSQKMSDRSDMEQLSGSDPHSTIKSMEGSKFSTHSSEMNST